MGFIQSHLLFLHLLLLLKVLIRQELKHARILEVLVLVQHVFQSIIHYELFSTHHSWNLPNVIMHHIWQWSDQQSPSSGWNHGWWLLQAWWMNLAILTFDFTLAETCLPWPKASSSFLVISRNELTFSMKVAISELLWLIILTTIASTQYLF